MPAKKPSLFLVVISIVTVGIMVLFRAEIILNKSWPLLALFVALGSTWIFCFRNADAEEELLQSTEELTLAQARVRIMSQIMGTKSCNVAQLVSLYDSFCSLAKYNPQHPQVEEQLKQKLLYMFVTQTGPKTNRFPVMKDNANMTLLYEIACLPTIPSFAIYFIQAKRFEIADLLKSAAHELAERRSKINSTEKHFLEECAMIVKAGEVSKHLTDPQSNAVDSFMKCIVQMADDIILNQAEQISIEIKNDVAGSVNHTLFKKLGALKNLPLCSSQMKETLATIVQETIQAKGFTTEAGREALVAAI